MTLIWLPPPWSEMPGQLHFGELAFTNCVKDLMILNMSHLPSGDGHEVLHP